MIRTDRTFEYAGLATASKDTWVSTAASLGTQPKKSHLRSADFGDRTFGFADLMTEQYDLPRGGPVIYVCHCAPVPICDNITQWLPWLVSTIGQALAPLHDRLVSLVVVILLHRE